MNGSASRFDTPVRVLAIGTVVLVMAGAILLVGPSFHDDEPPVYPEPVPMAPAAAPIAAEAGVFRIRSTELAAAVAADRRHGEHRRNLEIYRALRAFPGAPPRIPHGLTLDEYRTTRCNVCHERGGFSPRFEAYTPVTPHPELRECLQCHLPDDRLVGTALPDARPDAACRQCHLLDGRAPAEPAIDWPAPVWPEPGAAALPAGPPPIPHELQLRGNCLACHAGPGAVDEIRTSHPERASCRQCHVPAPPDERLFVRPASPTYVEVGGDS